MPTQFVRIARTTGTSALRSATDNTTKAFGMWTEIRQKSASVGHGSNP